MTKAEEVESVILASLEREPRVGLHEHLIQVSFDDGIVTVTGEVAGIAAKKLALRLAAAPSPVRALVDRLHVTPAEPMEDGAIRDHVCDAFISETAFRDYSLQALVKQDQEMVRTQLTPYMLQVEVQDGVVILNGVVESLSHKRLAGALAWWVPGSRDVINGLEVSPPMDDSDGELLDAVLLVLDKDPMVNSSQLRPNCRNGVVTLAGTATEACREAAESDAWFVLGVNDVINQIELQ